MGYVFVSRLRILMPFLLGHLPPNQCLTSQGSGAIVEIVDAPVADDSKHQELSWYTWPVFYLQSVVRKLVQPANVGTIQLWL